MRTKILGFLLALALFAPAIASAGTSGPSPIPPPPNFQVSTNVLTLCKGMINNVPISIRTPVGAALMQNVQLGLSNSKYAYTVGNGTVSAVNVSANLTKTVPLLIFASLNSTPLITAGISINYQYSTLYSDSEVRNISFGTETCSSSLSVGISPSVLVSGKIQNVTFNLTNSGKNAINYITMHASLPSPDGTFLGAQPVQVATIAPGGRVLLNEKVFIYSNASQSFPVNLSISMYNGSSIEQLSDSIIVLSSGIINITPSSMTLSPSMPSPGSIFSISFVLTDTGTAKASAVTATALVPKGFVPYGSNSVFVGDMQVDSQTPVTLTLTSESSLKAGNYTVPVRISYLNNLRQNLSTVIDIPITVGSVTAFNASEVASSIRRSGSSNAAIELLEIVIIILVLVLIVRERHHRRRYAIK